MEAKRWYQLSFWASFKLPFETNSICIRNILRGDDVSIPEAVLETKAYVFLANHSFEHGVITFTRKSHHPSTLENKYAVRKSVDDDNAHSALQILSICNRTAALVATFSFDFRAGSPPLCFPMPLLAKRNCLTAFST